MTLLSLLLLVKVAVTIPLIAVAGFGAQDRLNAYSGLRGHDPLIYRLYAVALAALVVGYAAALGTTLSGTMPWGTVWVGMVSNLGAWIVIQSWTCHPTLRRGSWIFAAIGLLLCCALIWPEAAIRPVA